MKTSKFTETQIVAILKESENGLAVADICRTHGISQATFYKWRSKYGGMDASLMKRLKELEAENTRLKKMYADSELDKQILRESWQKSSKAPRPPSFGSGSCQGSPDLHQAVLWASPDKRRLLPAFADNRKG